MFVVLPKVKAAFFGALEGANVELEISWVVLEGSGVSVGVPEMLADIEESVEFDTFCMVLVAPPKVKGALDDFEGVSWVVAPNDAGLVEEEAEPKVSVGRAGAEPKVRVGAVFAMGIGSLLSFGANDVLLEPNTALLPDEPRDFDGLSPVDAADKVAFADGKNTGGTGGGFVVGRVLVEASSREETSGAAARGFCVPNTKPVG